MMWKFFLEPHVLLLLLVICVVATIIICCGSDEKCEHDFKHGVSLEECREASRDLKIPYPRSFYKCTKCDVIEITVNSQRP